MTTTQQTIIAIVVILGIIGSFPLSRISMKREPIYGGLIAKIFHQLGVGSFIAVIPSGLLGGLFAGFLFGIGLALSFLAITFGFLYLFATIEEPHRKKHVVEDKGWTEADARASGM
jgi:hypothetical protein